MIALQSDNVLPVMTKQLESINNNMKHNTFIVQDSINQNITNAANIFNDLEYIKLHKQMLKEYLHRIEKKVLYIEYKKLFSHHIQNINQYLHNHMINPHEIINSIVHFTQNILLKDSTQPQIIFQMRKKLIEYCKLCKVSEEKILIRFFLHSH